MIYCNYSKSDWQRYLFSLLVIVLIMAVPIIWYVENIFKPLMNEFTVWVDFAYQDKTILHYANYSANQVNFTGLSASEQEEKVESIISVAFIVFVYSVPIIVTLPIVLWCWLGSALAKYIIRKIGYYPIMKLIIKWRK